MLEEKRTNCSRPQSINQPMPRIYKSWHVLMTANELIPKHVLNPAPSIHMFVTTIIMSF